MNLLKVIDRLPDFRSIFHQMYYVFGSFFKQMSGTTDTLTWKKVRVATLILRQDQPRIFRVNFSSFMRLAIWKLELHS